MKYHKLIVSESDHKTLLELIGKASLVDPVQKQCIEKLRVELERASIKPDAEMPEDVVQLGSVVDIDTPFGKKDGLEIVMPEQGDYQRKRLSVISPMGSALIGYAKGDVVTWPLRIGEQAIMIEKVQKVEKVKP